MSAKPALRPHLVRYTHFNTERGEGIVDAQDAQQAADTTRILKRRGDGPVTVDEVWVLSRNWS